MTRIVSRDKSSFNLTILVAISDVISSSRQANKAPNPLNRFFYY